MFNFKLQSVLDYRKKIEEKLLPELADLNRDLDIEKDELQEIRIRKYQFVSRLEKVKEGQSSAADISMYFDFINHLKEQESYKKKQVNDIEEKLLTARTNLIEAVKKRKVLETIRDKKLEEYKLSLAKRERKELDDLGTLRYGMRS